MNQKKTIEKPKCDKCGVPLISYFNNLICPKCNSGNKEKDREIKEYSSEYSYVRLEDYINDN